MKTVSLNRWFFFMGQVHGKDTSTGQTFCSAPGQIDDVWSDAQGNLFASVFYGQSSPHSDYCAIEVRLPKGQRASELEREVSIINLIGGHSKTSGGALPQNNKDISDAEFSH